MRNKLKRFSVIASITMVLVITGCSRINTSPIDDSQLSPQQIDSCSHQGRVWKTNESPNIYADASSTCYVIRDGRDELTMKVTVQRKISGSWVSIGTPTTTPRKTLPAGQTVGNVGWSHIKAYVQCEGATYRSRTDITAYVNGTNTVYETTNYVSPEYVIAQTACQ